MYLSLRWSLWWTLLHFDSPLLCRCQWNRYVLTLGWWCLYLSDLDGRRCYLYVVETVILLIKRLFSWFGLWINFTLTLFQFTLCCGRAYMWSHWFWIHVKCHIVYGTILLRKVLAGGPLSHICSIKVVVLKLLEDLLSCLSCPVDLIHFFPDLFNWKANEVFTAPSLAILAELMYVITALLSWAYDNRGVI